MSGTDPTAGEWMVTIPRRLLRELLDEIDYEKSNAAHGEAQAILTTDPTAGGRWVPGGECACGPSAPYSSHETGCPMHDVNWVRVPAEPDSTCHTRKDLSSQRS